MTALSSLNAPISAAALDGCASEPIRIPGGIQPHGALAVLDPATLAIRQASTNLAAYLGGDLGALDGWAAVEADLRAWMGGGESVYLRTADIGGQARQILAHQTPQGLIVEFEDGPGPGAETLETVYPRLRRFVEGLGEGRDVLGLCAAAAVQVREMTGFDRVLIYQFDAAWNGAVIAEANNGVLPTYMDLRFPASDIPAQARELYRLNRLRLIASASYIPSPITPELSPVDGKPLDLSLAALRSVSPVHLEYMRNMGTGASMSISILVDGALWGLISCHNEAPKTVSAHIRAGCDFLGQMLSLQIGARQRLDEAAERLRLKAMQTRLVAQLSGEPSIDVGLLRNGADWLRLTDASGAAAVTSDGVVAFGETPSREQIAEIAVWLDAQAIDGVFVTESLAEVMPGAEALSGAASGLAAVSISRLHASYLIWFRPEVVRTVTWGGDPRKPTSTGDRLHPRTSFEGWKELVRLRSAPWTPAQVESARDFRGAILDVVLERAEERAELTQELSRSNKELEAFSYSVSHDLRAPFRHIVGYAELLQDREAALDGVSQRYLRSISEAALSAGRLVDDLLAFSSLGRTGLHCGPVDMDKVVQETLRVLEPEWAGRHIEWRTSALPPAWGDAALLRQVMVNVVGNAVKYTRGRDPAVISISGEAADDATVYDITDNGVGFEMAYAAKLFGVFQRLHRSEEFEGTGIGLALVRRIIDRHGGDITATGEVGKGAAFRITLPHKTEDLDLG